MRGVSMPVRKMRVEVSDDEGNRYTITVRGTVTREKVLSILDIVELLGGKHSLSPKLNDVAKLSKYDKVRFIIEKRFQVVWFSLREVWLGYDAEFQEHISLSTVSTYLSRMVNRGFLMKKQASGRRKYRMVTEMMDHVMRLEKLKHTLQV